MNTNMIVNGKIHAGEGLTAKIIKVGKEVIVEKSIGAMAVSTNFSTAKTVYLENLQSPTAAITIHGDLTLQALKSKHPLRPASFIAQSIAQWLLVHHSDF